MLKLILTLAVVQSGLLFIPAAQTQVPDDSQCFAEFHDLQPDPVCPGDDVTYSCTVVGTNATIWTGDAFFCPNQTLNATELLHFQPNATAECWPYFAELVDAKNNCYTSVLTFNAFVELNTSVVRCLDASGEEIGNKSLVVSGLPSPPNMRVKECTLDSVTLEWKQPYDGGREITGYEINVDRNLPECNYSCAVGPDITEYQFNSLNLSQTYTFGLRADNCNNTQQGMYSKLIVTLGGPPGPEIMTTGLAYDDSGLTHIYTAWQEVEPAMNASECPQPVIQYQVTYSGDFSDNEEYTYQVDPFECSDMCSHSFVIPDDAPLYTISVTAQSDLGLGKPTVMDFIEKRNNMLQVEVNVSTPYPTITCHFLCGFHETAPCSITYYNVDVTTGETNTDASLKAGTSGSELMIPLTEPLPPDTEYVFQASVNGDSLRVQVQGSFTTGNYTSDCDPAELLTGELVESICSNTSYGLRSPNGTVVCYDSTSPGSLATYTCEVGFHPSTTDDTQEPVVVCQVNGLWSDRVDFTCVHDTKSAGGVSGAAIGGGVAGAVVVILGLLVVVVAVIAVVRRQRKKQKRLHIPLEFEGLYSGDEDHQRQTYQHMEGKAENLPMDYFTEDENESQQLLVNRSSGREGGTIAL